MDLSELLKRIGIDESIQKKIEDRHKVSMTEMCEAFLNRANVSPLLDSRAANATNPPTVWFIARTNSGRLLKVVYVKSGSDFIIKTTYPPNQAEIDIWIAVSGDKLKENDDEDDEEEV